MKPNLNTKFLFNKMDTSLIVVDDNDTIIKVNKSAENLFKTDQKVFIKKKIHSIFKNFDINSIKETILNNNLKIIKRDLFIKPTSDENIFASISITPAYNTDNEYTGSIITCTDISDKIDLINQLSSAQDKLKERTSQVITERDKFHMVIENISDGVLVMDHSFNIFYFNSSLEKIIGINGKRLMNSNLKEYFKEIYYSKLIKKRKYFRSEEIRITNKEDHSKIILMVNLAPIIMENGKKLNFVLTIRDITREKQIDEMKTQFVSNVSHELRTPLASIKGFASTLIYRKELSLDQKKKFLNIINDESDRLTRLIEDLLSLSRIEASSFRLQFIEFDLIKTIEDLKHEFENQIKNKNLTLEVISKKNIPKMIADRDKIFQIIINLVNNAIKFTKPGTDIEIQISFNNTRKFFTISVKDHGPGIPGNDINNIFKKFFRIENKVHTIPGTGLGLSIAKSIVDKHNGKISVKSKVDKETTFIVEIPQGELPLS